MTEIQGGIVKWTYVADTKSFTASALGVSAANKRVGASGIAAGDNIASGFGKAKLAALGLVAAVAGTVLVTKNLVSTAADYETAFTGVIKTNDGLDDGLGNLNERGIALRNELKQLATEVSGSFADIAGIAELGGQLGVASDQLTDFSRTIANIAVASNLTKESAATSFAQIGNILGVESENLAEFSSRFASSIVALGNNFATTEADITNFAQRIAGAGNIVGLTADQISGISAAFSSVGVTAEVGGTAVQKVLIGLNTAFVEGGDTLKTFADTAGLSVNEFSRLYEEDAASAFESFIRGLGQQGDQAITTLKELGLQDQRLIRSLLSVSNAGDLLNRTLESSSEAYADNVALTQEATKFNNTFNERIKNLQDRLSNFGDVLGTKVIEALDKYGPIVAEAVRETFNFAVAIGQDLAPVFSTLGDVLNNVIVPAFKATIGVFESLIDLVSPIAEFIGRQLTEAFISLYNTIRNDISPVIVELVNLFRDQFGPIIDFVRKNWENLRLVLIPFAAAVFGPLIIAAGAVTAALKLLSPVLRIATASFSFFAKITIFATSTVIKAVLGLVNFFIGAMKLFINAFQGGINFTREAFNVIANLFRSGRDVISGILSSIANAIFRFVDNAFGGLISRSAQKLGEFISLVSEIPGRIIQAFGDAKDLLLQVGRDIITGLINGIQNQFNAVKDKIGEIAGGIKDTFKSALDIFSPSRVFAGYGKDITDGLVVGLNDGFSDVEDTLNSSTDSIKADAEVAVTQDVNGNTTGQLTAVSSGSATNQFFLNITGTNTVEEQREQARRIIGLYEQSTNTRGRSAITEITA